MLLNNKVKGICVIIGGIFMHILTGTVHVWSSLNVYLISYLRIYDKSLTLGQGFFIGPLGVFAMCLSMSLGGYLERNYGPRQVTTLGLSFIIAGHVILYFSHSLFIDYGAMIISGMGIGCNYLIPMRLGFKYFPKNKGLVSGFVQLGLAFTATFLNIIAEAIINPKGLNPSIVEGGDRFFSEEVARHVKDYLILYFIVAGIMGVITVILFFPYSPEEENKVGTEGLIPEDQENKPVVQQPEVIPQNEDREITSVGQAIRTRAFWLILLTALFSDILPPLVCNTFRVYAQNKEYDTIHLKYLQSGFSGANSFFRPLWGFCFDLFGFKALLFPTNAILIIIGIFIFYTIQSKWLFTILVTLTGLMMGVFYSIFPAYTTKIFGIKLSSEIYGLVFIGLGLASLLGPSFFFLIKGIVFENDYFPFKIAYFIGAGFALLGMITCFFAPKEPKKEEQKVVKQTVEENKN